MALIRSSTRSRHSILMSAFGTKLPPEQLKSRGSLRPLCGVNGPIADTDLEHSNVRFR